MHKDVFTLFNVDLSPRWVGGGPGSFLEIVSPLSRRGWGLRAAGPLRPIEGEVRTEGERLQSQARVLQERPGSCGFRCVRRTCCELKGIPVAEETLKAADTWDQGPVCGVVFKTHLLFPCELC